MTTFCECKTCKKIKNEIEKRIKFPQCVYCGKHHDTQIICPEYKSVLESTGYNTPKTAKALKKAKYEYYVEVENGKYAVYMEKNGTLKALRYGETWRDLCGDNLVYNLMVELIEAQDKIKEVLEYIELPGPMDDIYIKEILLEEEK